MKLIGTQVAVGIIKNKRNSLWQVWASLDGNDVTCLSAHRVRSAAQTVADEFARAYENEELDTPRKSCSVYRKHQPGRDADAALADDFAGNQSGNRRRNPAAPNHA